MAERKTPRTVETLTHEEASLAVDEDDELIDRAAEPRADYGPQQDLAGMILEQLATGRIPVLKARMNADLHMATWENCLMASGEQLKALLKSHADGDDDRAAVSGDGGRTWKHAASDSTIDRRGGSGNRRYWPAGCGATEGVDGWFRRDAAARRLGDSYRAIARESSKSLAASRVGSRAIAAPFSRSASRRS